MAISLPRINPAPLESGGDSLKAAADKINSAMLAIEQQALPTIGASDGLKVLRAKEDRTGYELEFAVVDLDMIIALGGE